MPAWTIAATSPSGCRILTQPLFFDEHNWLLVPVSWSDHIVSLKTFTTDNQEGLALWEAVTKRPAVTAPFVAEPGKMFGTPRLVRPRLSQGAFRVVVIDDYQWLSFSATGPASGR